ncbi:MAG: hypothetical protein KUG71_07250 [Porticoccaceae bacterium]|nr:hypothetical protein [Porticoccaceae bacterium]
MKACFYYTHLLSLPLLLCSLLLLSGCNSPITVKSTTYTPLSTQTSTLPEAELLDLGVLTFDPGLDDLDDDEEASILPEVRKAEAHYLANQLTLTIQDSAAWGAVRLLPSPDVITDIYVSGTIKHSDGEMLELDIAVTDTSGREVYAKTYKGLASKYAYERRRKLQRDPFQGLFNRIANDLLVWRQKLSAKEAINLRTVSSLRFARQFSPEAFSEHLQSNRKGQLTVARLPATDDPILHRVQSMRERDYLYIDTVQEYYDAFSRQMSEPYQTWRAESYDEVMAARDLKRQSLQRTAGGVIAILAGIAASGSNSGAARASGAVAIGSGALLVKSGLGKKAEAQIHIEALAELGQSLEAEIEPRVIDLEDQTITLTGNVQMQYEQWQALLQKIYRAERGEI